MRTLTRISKLKGFNNVIVGRDLSQVFEPGHVYGFRKIAGQIIVDDLGEHFVPEHMTMQTIGQIMMDGSYLLTPAEQLKAEKHQHDERKLSGG